MKKIYRFSFFILVLSLFGCIQSNQISYLESLEGDWHHCEQVPEIEGSAVSIRWHFRDDGTFTNVKAGSTSADCQSIIVVEINKGHYKVDKLLPKNKNSKQAVLSLNIDHTQFKKKDSGLGHWIDIDSQMDFDSQLKQVVAIKNDQLYILETTKKAPTIEDTAFQRFDKTVSQLSFKQPKIALK